MKVRDIPRLKHENGWRQVAQKGSHRQFKHPVKSGRVTVAGHPSEDMDEGTRKSILEQAGLEP
jgi:predicted RNA binding protein YcfA (HicA-like mRNA interferase family)